VICLPAVLGTTRVLTSLDVYRRLDVRQQTMVAYLERTGLTRLYTDYWSCNRFAFQSNERVVCAVLDEHMHSGLDRYRPYRALVHAARYPTYAFPRSLPQAGWLRQVGAGRRAVSCDGYLIITLRGPAVPPLTAQEQARCSLS